MHGQQNVKKWHVLLRQSTCNRDYASIYADARIISLKILAFRNITEEYKCDLNERINPAPYV